MLDHFQVQNLNNQVTATKAPVKILEAKGRVTTMRNEVSEIELIKNLQVLIMLHRIMLVLLLLLLLVLLVALVEDPQLSVGATVEVNSDRSKMV